MFWVRNYINNRQLAFCPSVFCNGSRERTDKIGHIFYLCMMKKFLIIFFIIPLASFAQQRVPNFPTDSISGHIQYRVTLEFPGGEKAKIFGLLIHWLSAEVKTETPGFITDDITRNARIASITGFIYSGREFKYDLKLAVTDGLAVITLSNFQVAYGGTDWQPLEAFCTQVKHEAPYAAATKPVMQVMPGMNSTDKQPMNVVVKMAADYDSNALDDVDQTAESLLRDARKYAKKAKKQGLI